MTLRNMTNWKDKKVVVTGGAGFIGSHVVRRLEAEGARVTVLDNLQSGKWENVQDALPEGRCGTALCAELGLTDHRSVLHQDACRGVTDHRSVLHQDEKAGPSIVRCVAADVRDARAVRDVVRHVRPDVVLHLAANASVPGSVSDPEYDFGSNALGTFNVLEAVRHECLETRVVSVSSAAVYGEPSHFPITEDSELAPISPYGASKLSAEIEARMFHAVYKVPVVIARLFNTYGPGMPRFVILDFLRKLQKDPARLEILGTGKQLRDFNYVGDTVAGILALAERGIPGEAYNVASGVSHSVTDLAHILIDAMGLTGRTMLSFTGESWAGDAQRWEVSISKMRELGYRPQTGLRDGLEKVIAWFEAENGKLH
jgi:UDP-glucose 4-epimerase